MAIDRNGEGPQTSACQQWWRKLKSACSRLGPGMSMLVVFAAGIALLLVGIWVGMVLSGTAVGMRFSWEIVQGLAWPVTVFGLAFLFRNEISGLLRRLKKGKLLGVELTFADIVNVEEAVKEAGKEPPGRPKSVPIISPKERIKRAWQRVHDTLADVYTTEVEKEPPPQYKTLASRLRRWGHLTDENVWDLIHRVRTVYRKVQRTSQANDDLAKWYAATVEKVIERIDEETTKS